MEGPGRCVKTQNEMPRETKAGVFRLKMKCHGGHAGVFRLKMKGHGMPRPVCLGAQYSAIGGPGRCV